MDFMYDRVSPDYHELCALAPQWFDVEPHDSYSQQPRYKENTAARNRDVETLYTNLVAIALGTAPGDKDADDYRAWWGARGPRRFPRAQNIARLATQRGYLIPIIPRPPKTRRARKPPARTQPTTSTVPTNEKKTKALSAQ